MDRQLVEQAQRGDRNAYESLARASASSLYRTAYRIVRDRDRADDAVQQTLVAIWRELPSLRDPDRFESWTYRLVVRFCLSESRRARRTGVREIPMDEAEPARSDGFADSDLRDQLAANYPEIKTVIAIAPPMVTWDDGAGRSSFSFKGKPVPFVVPFGLERLAQPFNDAVAAGRDFRTTIPGIVAKIKADPAMAAAIPPLEKIKGSVLILSGTDDIQGPGVVQGELAMDRLKASKFAFPYRHIIGDGAGHLLEFPNVDRAIEISEGGGSPEANELAGEAMWPVVLEYLAAMR